MLNSLQKRRDHNASPAQEQSHRVFSPTVDIAEDDQHFVLIADMPGVTEQSVELTLDDDLLVIEGRVDQSAPEGYEPAERSQGHGLRPRYNCR